MAFGEIERPSPNRAQRPHEHLGVLFHHSGMEFEATIARMQSAASRVSYHCLIGADGTRCTLVRDEDVAWHAGVSRFLGRDNCNDFLLGVAFSGDTSLAPLSSSQLESALEWLASRWTVYGWELGCMTDHRQAAQGRKHDLNPAEWARLHAAIRAKFAQPDQ